MTALSLTEVGKTGKTGFGGEPGPLCWTHCLKCLLGIRVGIQAPRSQERRHSGGMNLQIVNTELVFKAAGLHGFTRGTGPLGKRTKDWALVLSSNSERSKQEEKTAEELCKDWPVRWEVSQQSRRRGVSEASEEHEWRRSCATFWGQVK